MERQCTLLIHYDKGSNYEASEMLQQLEKGSAPEKRAAMKKAIMLVLNGENIPPLLMTIIRFVLTQDDHQLKKLTLLYLEVVEKTDNGKLLPEMILVCNMLRNDINHPNEFVRGCTLRFLAKLKEPEVLEPLVPAIKLNLEHRHSYVRRYASMAMFNIFKNFEYLAPDAPETIEKLLLSESDTSTQRNAFLMLVQCAQERAVDYILGVIDQVATYGDIVQMVMLDLIRKVCRQNPLEKSRYIKAIFMLLTSASHTVSFECAGTLVSLSSSNPAVRAAATSYCSLLSTHSDNNVKLIVLDKLIELKDNHSNVMQDMLMDIVRVLSSPNLDIKRKILDITMDLITPRNIDEVVQVLKKEVMKTANAETEKAPEYRQMLIQVIHTCALKYPDIAQSVVLLLMDFLGDSNANSASDVVFFVREVVETYPNLRETVLRRLDQCFATIKATRVHRVALWIFAEYSATQEEVLMVLETLKLSLGQLPFLSVEEQEETKEAAAATPAGKKGPTLLADGTYASTSHVLESAASSAPNAGPTGQPTLRSLLLGGDYFLAGVVATTLTKLAMKICSMYEVDELTKNKTVAEVMMILVQMIRLGQTNRAVPAMDDDSYERISTCLYALAGQGDESAQQVWLSRCRDSFARMLEDKQEKEKEDKKDEKRIKQQADEVLHFRMLKGKSQVGQIDLEDDEGQSEMSKALGEAVQSEDLSYRLSRITQLTGLADPIYAEAFVTVHQYDIVLDVLVINQTDETLQNVCLELATVGDLKLCERPQQYTLAPKGSRNIRANIKVSSTETGIIFGNIIYEQASLNQNTNQPPPSADMEPDNRNCVILNDIHIDIMDYIAPATCSDVQFRSMWAEFEWENKVAVNTSIADVNEFLEHIIKSTNMKCLTPRSALEGDCGFLAANLYAKSIFGEDALVNISIEKQTDGKICGNIRIRSKTQGIALSLGDKITLKQKGQ
jgi:coatomer subunit beta